MSLKRLSLAVALAVAGTAVATAATAAATKASQSKGKTASSQAEIQALNQQIHAGQAQIAAMQTQLEALQKKVDSLQAAQAAQPAVAAAPPAPAEKPEPITLASTHTKDTGITIGGAVRFQYVAGDYNRGVNKRKGDIQFDIFRLDLKGKVHGVILDAQWRWFQYMTAIQHAWVGYDFTDTSQLQIGLTRIPFGNQPFDSHSFFFSSNYYVGLEDTYAAGVEYVYSGDPWNVQLAFFKNDTTGGVGGGNRTNSYSYDILGVREPGEGIFDAPSHDAGSIDTVAARAAYTFKPTSDLSVQLGASGMYGGLQDPNRRIGHYYAAALHSDINYKRWNLKLQASRYAYSTDTHATGLVVGAYAYYDTIAAKANTYTAGVAYHLPVSWGPVQSLDIYNDYSLINNKSGGLRSTFMNDLGVGVTAGDMYTYFDFVTARNQPFIGGSMAGNGKVDNRFNINFGFYY